MNSKISLRHSTEYYSTSKPCGCRSVGECDHDSYADLIAETRALNGLVDDFAAHLKEKLRLRWRQGRCGWDNPEWPREKIIQALLDHVPKGDMIDVAAFAMFAWNQVPVTKDEASQ